MPKGYFVAEIEVTKQDGYDQYRAQVLATIEKYGGRFLVRGGDPKLVEGSPAASRVVILEFDSPARAMEWYNSPEYQAILPLRTANSIGRAHCVTGA